MLLYDLDEISERMLLYGGTVFIVLLVSSLIAFCLSSAQLRAVIETADFAPRPRDHVRSGDQRLQRSRAETLGRRTRGAGRSI